MMKRGYVPMRACSYEFGHGVGESGKWIDIKYRIRIFTIVHASLREDDRDEMYARTAEQV